MDHNVDLQQLQMIVGKYVDKYNLVVAAGPMAGAMFVKTFISNNKAMNYAVVASGAWFAVQELSAPMTSLFKDQFGYLQSLLAQVM